MADAGVYRAIHELLRPKSEGILSPQILDLLKLSADPAAAHRRVERELRQFGVNLGSTLKFIVETINLSVDPNQG